jgi:DNA-binding GntR family transcriptional regulator
MSDHHHIVEALKARDSKAAREAMLAHLGRVEEKLKRLVEGGESEKKEEDSQNS